MKTIILDEPGRFALTDTSSPQRPGPGEALVRVLRIGVCGTDFHAFEGTQPYFSYPRVLGHELAVEVVALGPSDMPLGLTEGVHCAVRPYLNCGRCSACRRGAPNCCENLRVIGVHIDGGMRDEFVVPIIHLHVAPTLSADHLALVEPLAIGAHAARRPRLAPGEHVLVIGAGPIGLATMQFVRLAGADITLLEINPKRVEFARHYGGVERVIQSLEDAPARLREMLGGDLPTAVFDATGNPRSMMSAVQYLASAGKLIFVGLVQGQLSLDDPEFHRREVTLYRSRNATAEDFNQVISALEADAIDLNPWITHRAAPEAMLDEFQTWMRPESGVVKAIVEWA